MAENQALREALQDTTEFMERHSNRWDVAIGGKHPAVVIEAAREALATADPEPLPEGFNVFLHLCREALRQFRDGNSKMTPEIKRIYDACDVIEIYFPEAKKKLDEVYPIERKVSRTTGKELPNDYGT
jgi:hypothetical protein